MAILTGIEIIRQRDLGKITIEPFNDKNVNPNSYDMTLSPGLMFYDQYLLDPKENNKTDSFSISEEGHRLYPGNIYLGSTQEVCGSRDFVPHLEGKSSIGRLGIQIHITAGFGDLGFIGNWTLEISVIKPVIIYPNMRICQVVFHTVEGPTDIQYQGKYRDARQVQASRSYRDFDK